ncbi:MAG: sensor histidine kinase, partial [Acidimicrobiia bacterium]
VLDESTLGPGREWVASTLSVATLLGEVKESTRRVSELVAAVRSYSQLDRASMQPLEVTDGLDSTLAMLGHKLGDGVTVLREYGDDVPRIEASAGELNQVWTNLIDNALDSMGEAGKLTLRTRSEKGMVVVEVIDDGPGIPPEIQGRIFDAFFTTKPQGQGTGIGLNTTYKMVTRHGGDIRVSSQPGETTFRVALPLRLPARREES